MGNTFSIFSSQDVYLHFILIMKSFIRKIFVISRGCISRLTENAGLSSFYHEREGIGIAITVYNFKIKLIRIKYNINNNMLFI